MNRGPRYLAHRDPVRFYLLIVFRYETGFFYLAGNIAYAQFPVIIGNAGLFRGKIDIDGPDAFQFAERTLDVHGAVGTGHTGNRQGYGLVSHCV